MGTTPTEATPEPTKCKYCKHEIQKDASVCDKCGNFQNKIGNFFKSWFVPLISFGTLIFLGAQVFIVIKQTNLAERQVEIAEANKIKTEDVLKEANAALAEAETAKTKADDVLMEANKEAARLGGEIQTFGDQLNLTDERLKSTEQRFTDTQRDLSGKVIALKEELSKELKVLKMRNVLELLADKAISTGDAASYDELNARLIKPQGFYLSIKAEIISVKRFYMGTTRLKDVNLLKDGVKTQPTEFSTDELINDLLNNKNWQVRALVANELGKRKVKGVPEVLIQGMKDANLDVRRNCIKSFERITGYDNPDILDGDHAINWWPQNKKEIEKNLAEK